MKRNYDRRRGRRRGLRVEHGLAVGLTSFRRYVWLEFPARKRCHTVAGRFVMSIASVAVSRTARPANGSGTSLFDEARMIEVVCRPTQSAVAGGRTRPGSVARG